MQKIKDRTLKRLYRLDENSKFALRIMLELFNISNEEGETDIYYKNMAKSVGCKISTFYNVIHDLEDMDYIELSKAEYKGDIHVKIMDNDFKDEEGYSNYCDTNSEFFVNRMYNELGAGAIKTYLFLMLRVLKAGVKSETGESLPGKKKNKLRYKKSTSYAKIAIQIGLCPLNTKAEKVEQKHIRSVKKYVNELIKKGLVAYGTALKDDSGIYITVIKQFLETPLVEVSEKGKRKKEKSNPMLQHWKHFVSTVCRRNKKSFDEQNLFDTAMLINQYKNKAESLGRDVYAVLLNAIADFDDIFLDSIAIHGIVKKMMKKDYSYDILVR